MESQLLPRPGGEAGRLGEVGGSGALRSQLVAEHLARSRRDHQVEALDVGVGGQAAEDVAGEQHPRGAGDQQGDAVHGAGGRERRPGPRAAGGL